MAYRGEDLDLRTPQGWGPPGRDAPAANEPNWWTRSTIYKGGRGDPIWIDDNVMACCNHAYDLAVVHRAPEVRLEHLINAMTLNPDIAKVMEGRGIGVASLRRESGAIISSEIPAGPSNGKVQPKRSEALEEALRQAADFAYPRRTPVTVEDILHVLFDMKRDVPGVQLLQRHTAPWAARDAAPAEPKPELRLEPLPHLAPRPYGGEPRYSPAEEPRPRYASQAAQDYFTQPAQPPQAPYVPPQPPQQPVYARGPREREAATSVDSVQNTRIESLERAVRDLGLDLVEERKSLQSIVGELQRQTSVQADDTNRFRGSLADRLSAMEDTLSRARSEPMPVPAAIFDRIAGLERTIEGRVGDVSRGWAAISERLQSIEQASRRQTEPVLPPALVARLEQVEGLARKLDSLESTFSLILDRLTGLERKLDSAPQAKPVDLMPLQVRIGDLERNLLAKVQQSVDQAPVAELLSGIESRVVGLERSIENRSAETGRTVSFIGERLRAFEESLNAQKSQVGGELTERLTALESKLAQAGAAHEQDLSEMHDALIKLNSNQEALSGSLEQWRLDNTGDLSVVSNRLKAIEDVSSRRDPMLEALAAQVSAIHGAVAKREVHKSRFRQWLFGTQ